MRKNQSGFAHLELLVILALVIGMGIFTFSRFKSDRTSKAETISSGLSRPRVDQKIAYQVNIPFYQHNAAGEQNAIAAITDRLDNIAKLGVNLIQLTPVHTSAYLVLDHYDVSWKYTGKTRTDQGTKEERIAYLKNYVDKAHGLGMKVLLDCVFHGTAKNSPLVTQHPEWYKYDSSGKIVVNQFGLPQFDTSKPEVQAFALDVAKYWQEQTGIDGCRTDMAHSIPLPFWATLNTEMKKINPMWLMFGETFGTQVEYVQRNNNQESASYGQFGFDGAYDFYLQSVLRGIADKKRTVKDVYKAWSARPSGYKGRYYNMIDDQNAPQRSVTMAGGNAGMIAASAVNFTLDGVPFIFNGQEIGDPTAGGPMIDETRFYAWETPPHPENQKSFARLSCLRKRNPSLSSGVTSWKLSDDEQVVAYTRTRGKEKSLVVVNLSDRTWSGSTNLSTSKGSFDMITRRTYGKGGGELKLTLKPYSYFIGNLTDAKRAAKIAAICAR